MATIHAIAKLGMPEEWAFPGEVEELFEAMGAKVDDQFTYTMRVQVDTSDEAAIERARQRLRDTLPEDKAERLIAYLEREDWDISFLVDCY